ncbi:MAG: HDIG domain-containing protein [Chloroflexi bacterium]|nr:HDIG domain-containing protein [Chloroflexota bacterium]
MSSWLADLLEKYFNVPPEKTVLAVRRLAVIGAAVLFVLITTVVVAFDDLSPEASTIAALQVGDIARQDIHAPISLTYVSDVLTNQRREAAAAAVQPVYDAPDPNVARRQAQLARQILDFILNVRRDPFGSPQQKLSDLSMITALTLDEPLMQRILTVDDSTWQAIDEQVVTVLERVMRDEIREADIFTIQGQLPLEVSVRSSAEDAALITAIVSDLLRPNTFENPAATASAQQQARDNVPPEQRSFERGQIVVREGTRLEAADYEALNQLGLLRPADYRIQALARALLATVITIVTLGLYIARFQPQLFEDSPRFLVLIALLFLLTLVGARFLGVNGQIYVYPSAALALLFVAIVGADVAAMGILSLAVLTGLMADNSLEIAVLVASGGMIGIPTLRRSENFNSYFFAGLMIGIMNIAIIALFNLATPLNAATNLLTLFIYGLLNGILSAAAALVGLYLVTQLLNLPTSLKLLELSRPNHPLLQRLLREAPGTYQHSLQVANLCEQAANRIGANAELVHVAALYHDIGKMENAQFFVENQVNNISPHTALNDPYRSAAIIIDHVIEGDQLARQHRLPKRIRDFIKEHHGTTRVAYFYNKAVEQAGDEAAVNIENFMYPGPRPQTRETAILMLADGCESTVRARRPGSKAEIADIVHEIVQAKLADEQLDDSKLTLSDLKEIQTVFVEMLQGVFHPRINYPTPAKTSTQTAPIKSESGAEADAPPRAAEEQTLTQVNAETEAAKPQQNAGEFAGIALDDDEADTPLAQVPPLRRTTETRLLSVQLDGAEDPKSGEKEKESGEKP